MVQASDTANGLLSIKVFGAKGDGKAYDTIAVRAWLAGVGKSGVGYCPAGTYKIGRPLKQPEKSIIWGPPTCVVQPNSAITNGAIYEKASLTHLSWN